MSWVINNNWLIHKSLGLKPDWLEEINSFSMKYSLSVQKFFHKLEVKIWVDNFFFFFFRTGSTFAFFHSVGNSPCFIQDWNIKSSGLQIDYLHSFNMWLLSMSWPWTLLGSRFWNNVAISWLVKVIVKIDLSVLLQRLKESSLELLYNTV